LIVLFNRTERESQNTDTRENAPMASKSKGKRRRAKGAILAAAAVLGCLAFALPAQADPVELLNLSSEPVNEDLTPSQAAGAHPWELITSFEVNESEAPPGSGNFAPAGNLRDAETKLPPGAIGNAENMPKCRQENMNELGNCPAATQVGVAFLKLQFIGPPVVFPAPVYNLVPPPGMPAQFGVVVVSSITHIDFSVRSDSDYGITATLHRINAAAPMYGSKLVIWGVPGDPSHNGDRTGTLPPPEFDEDGDEIPPPPLPRKPLLTNPTSCHQPLRTTVAVNTFQDPVNFVEEEALAEPMVGCDQLDFKPTIEAKPTTNLADSPSGLEFSLQIPQNEDPDGSATALLREAKVQFPPGFTVNPSSANGLGACSPEQIGLTTPVGQANAHFNLAPASCPDASKIGSVRIDTALLDHPMEGSVYLATQGANPFGSVIALYLVTRDEKSGVSLKLPGKIDGDPATGQLTATFSENPQLPFDKLTLKTFEGSGAALKTAINCGRFTTTTQMTPWTSPEGATATPSSSFEIARGAGDAPCVSSEGEAPKQPSFSAGTLDPTAGVYSPFVLKLARQDGSQQLTGIDASLPPGLIARLKGVPYCSDAALAAAANGSGKAELSNPSCPAASKIGSVTAGAGAGPTPVNVGGSAYLAGPYKGAPVSVAVITPAVAGPFDLGNVMIRTALYVDPETTQVRAVSDRIPSVLKGIAIDLRSISVNLDRPQFTRNPTSCNPFTITGATTTLAGQKSDISSHFQVGECGTLRFRPKLALTLKGGTKRSDHPALKAVLTAREGEANIAGAAVTLPRSEFLENAHIKAICTRVQFAAEQCPTGSIYGKARAVTPLLDKPIEGPVYLRSSSHQLPDLVADLKGQLEVVLVGRIDSVNRGIRNSFELVPDAPVSKFVLEMQGGKKGLLVNNRDLCKSVNRATVLFDGQNGKTYDTRPVVASSCGRDGKSKGKKRRAGR
jgi:hypothetical protein